MLRATAPPSGIMLIAGGLLGAVLTWSDGHQEDASETRLSPMHTRMHRMMDQRMGSGAADQMHAMMPRSEGMMEACASGMGNMLTGTLHDMPMDALPDSRE